MKSFYSGSIIKLLLAAAIAIVLINDLGSIVASHYLLGDRTRDIAKVAADIYQISGSKSRAMAEAEIAAGDLDAVLTDFEITNDDIINISIEVPNQRTWVAHRVKALKPFINVRADYSRRTY